MDFFHEFLCILTSWKYLFSHVNFEKSTERDENGTWKFKNVDFFFSFSLISQWIWSIFPIWGFQSIDHLKIKKNYVWHTPPWSIQKFLRVKIRLRLDSHWVALTLSSRSAQEMLHAHWMINCDPLWSISNGNAAFLSGPWAERECCPVWIQP